MEPIVIDTRPDYDYCVSQGFEPLTDSHFVVAHPLRVSLQRELFGTGHTPEENERFYRFCWKHKPHICEECMKPLKEYSATYISHIRTRGAFPEMAFDCRNVNILCFEHHKQWENGDRKSMRIYGVNEFTIEQLEREYR